MYSPSPLTTEERIDQLEQTLESTGDRLDALQERIETMQEQVDMHPDKFRSDIDDGR